MSQQSNKKTPASKTGSGPTVMVAIEQHFPPGQRIIHDDLAYKIVPWGMRAWVWMMRPRPLRNWMVRLTEKELPGIWSGMMCRKRYIDEQAVATVASGENTAIVNLGAGFDTRPYRLPELTQVPVWEVDMAVNLTPKQARLEKIFGRVPGHVTLAPINFDREDLGTVLAAAGYKGNVPTFFIWEAVSQYLTEDGIQATFDFLAGAAAGSRLAFTYVPRDFIAGENLYGLENIYQQYVIKDKMWRFGWDPDKMGDFLGEYGWRLVEHLSYAELGERYTKPTGRDLPTAMPIEFMVLAEKA